MVPLFNLLRFGIAYAMMFWQVSIPFPGPGMPAAAPAGIAVTDAGSTVQTSGHTCTIASVALSSGDSIAIMGVTSPTLNGTLTATWNGNTCTELGSGEAVVPDIEGHAFQCSNVTGATGSVVVTKTNAADDSAIFDCSAAKVSGLTTHSLDKSASGNFVTTTTYTTPASGTTTASAEGVVALLGIYTNTTASFGTWQNSFTRLNNGGNASGVCCRMDWAKYIASSTGSFTGQTTGGATDSGVGFIFTFK